MSNHKDDPERNNPPKVSPPRYSEEKRDFVFDTQIYDTKSGRYFDHGKNLTADEVDEVKKGWVESFWKKRK